MAQSGSKSETVSAVKDALGGLAAKTMATMARDKVSFAKNAAISDLYEIQAAEIALKRSRRDDVRKLAERMIHDHRKTSDELKSALGSADVPMTPPTELDSVHQVLIDDLEGAGDADFDKRYVSQQEIAHDGALTLFRTYRDDGDDAVLRALCEATVPTLESHMEQVRAIAQTVK